MNYWGIKSNKETWILLVFGLIALLIPESFGTKDFMEYWSSFQIFCNHQNPYSPQNMLLTQQRLIDPYIISPQMMWNPPWIFPILVPILVWPFEVAFRLFFFTQLASIYFGVKIILGIDGQIKKQLDYVILAICFLLPIVVSLQLGQLGGILFLGLCLLIKSLNERKLLIGAVAVAILSLKPHLFAPALLALSIRRDFAVRNASAAALLILLCLVLLCVNPNIFDFWINAVNSATIATTVSPREWKTASMIALFNRGNVHFANYILALNSMILFFTALLLRSLKSESVAVYIISTGVLLSPFLWIFDEVSLLPFVWLLILDPAFERYSNVRFAFVFANCLGGILFLHNGTYHHQLVWYGPLLAVTWLGLKLLEITDKRKKSAPVI